MFKEARGVTVPVVVVYQCTSIVPRGLQRALTVQGSKKWPEPRNYVGRGQQMVKIWSQPRHLSSSSPSQPGGGINNGWKQPERCCCCFIRVFFPTRVLLTVFVDNEPGSVWVLGSGKLFWETRRIPGELKRMSAIVVVTDLCARLWSKSLKIRLEHLILEEKPQELKINRKLWI